MSTDARRTSEDQAGQHAQIDEQVEKVRRLIETAHDMDYDPSQEAWICGPHGLAECVQDTCPGLPWPGPNADPMLGAFMDWADREFLREVRPYDEGRVPEMPEESFRSYSLWEWPLGAFLEAFPTAATSPTP